MLVEEVPKGRNTGNSTIYFSSSVNLSARPNWKSAQRQDEEDQGSSSQRNPKSRPKVNYNVNSLMNAQTKMGSAGSDAGPLKSAQQVQLERLVSRRLVELNRETNTASFELPKNFAYSGKGNSGGKRRQGNNPATKKILSAKRNLNSYFEEEKNYISINSILSLNYQFVEQFDNFTEDGINTASSSHGKSKPWMRLCCICGSLSDYSRCRNCGLFYCSINCNILHEQSRCK